MGNDQRKGKGRVGRRSVIIQVVMTDDLVSGGGVVVL